MTDVYAMRRANGDWFALEEAAAFRVPVFHSSHDAFMARLRTVEMLLFSPIALTAVLLKEIVAGPKAVAFCMVNNPFASLTSANPLQHAEVSSLIESPAPPRP